MTQAAAQRRVYVKAEWRAGCPKDGQLRGFADLMTPPGFGSAHLQENRIERELAATRSGANGLTSGSNPSPNHKTYFFKTMLYSHAASTVRSRTHLALCRTSIRLDPGLLHHRAPPRGLVAHECAVFFGRAALDVSPLIGQAPADVGHVQDVGERGIQSLHDRLRCARGGEHPGPKRHV